LIPFRQANLAKDTHPRWYNVFVVWQDVLRDLRSNLSDREGQRQVDLRLSRSGQKLTKVASNFEQIFQQMLTDELRVGHLS
jgi:hypothetical protein